MWNSYNIPDPESGKPSGNRGYELETMTVLCGEDELSMYKVKTTNTEEAYASDNRFFTVTLTLDKEVETRYLWIDIQAALPGHYGTPDDMGAYIVTLDEIEIYGEKESGEHGNGDVSGDGEADSYDAAMILKFETGKANLSAEQIKAGDINGDNEIDSLDATIILRKDVGK